MCFIETKAEGLGNILIGSLLQYNYKNHCYKKTKPQKCEIICIFELCRNKICINTP
jgi:hypothetical protein